MEVTVIGARKKIQAALIYPYVDECESIPTTARYLRHATMQGRRFDSQLKLCVRGTRLWVRMCLEVALLRKAPRAVPVTAQQLPTCVVALVYDDGRQPSGCIVTMITTEVLLLQLLVTDCCWASMMSSCDKS